MKPQKLNLHFHLRGTWVHFTINTRQGKIRKSTDIEVIRPDLWDEKKDRVKPSHPNANSINQAIAGWEMELSRCHQHALKNNKPFNQALVNEWLKQKGLKEPEDLTFFQFATEVLSRQKGITEGTRLSRKAQIQKVERFSPGLLLRNFNRDFILRYEAYMRDTLGNTDNSVQSSMKKIRMFIEEAYQQDLLPKNPFGTMQFKGTRAEDIMALEPKHLTLIEQTQFVPELQQIANLFLLQCYTGLAYIDLKTLSPENITEIEGERWIIKKRQKTAVKGIVPVFPKTMRMLQQFDFQNKGSLPMPALVTYNMYLDQLGTFLNLPIKITSHVGRKTFSSIMENFAGLDLDVVAKMIGQLDTRTTRSHYTHILYARIKTEISEKNVTIFD